MTTTRTSGSGATARGPAGVRKMLGSRLRRARALRAMSQTKLGKLIGTSSNQVSMIESGHSGTSVHTMIAAAAALDVSMDFLAGRVDATAPMRELVRSLAEKDAAIHDLRSSVPKVDGGGAMGHIEVMEIGKFTERPRSRQWSEAKPMVRFPTTWLRENGLKPLKCRLAKVVGKGMEPTLAEGRRIIVDLTTTGRKHDRVCLVEIEDELVVKRMVRGENGGYLLKSDNPDKSRFPTVPWHDEARVIGAVSWIETVPAASVKTWEQRTTRGARPKSDGADSGSKPQSGEDSPMAANPNRRGRGPQKGSSVRIVHSLLFGTAPDGKQWIGTCPSLDVATVGDTRERAVEALEEAVNLWTESCVQRGTIREALTELGFVAVQGPPLTNDFCQVDDKFYWRFPDYLPSAQGERTVRTVPDATPETGPDFEYRPHTGQTEMGWPRTTAADTR